jgi:tetratricopeptide (TPR) repeat protein
LNEFFRILLEIYEQGMRSFPHKGGLPFNLAVTYERMKKADDARRMYERALRADPKHLSSHYRLAALFLRNGYQIPGILAYFRFLELTPDARRSKEALQAVVSQLFGAARSGKEPNHGRFHRAQRIDPHWSSDAIYRGGQEAFTYSILKESGWPDVNDWLGKNPDKVNAYTEWTRTYPWIPDAKQKK